MHVRLDPHAAVVDRRVASCEAAVTLHLHPHPHPHPRIEEASGTYQEHPSKEDLVLDPYPHLVLAPYPHFVLDPYPPSTAYQASQLPRIHVAPPLGPVARVPMRRGVVHPSCTDSPQARPSCQGDPPCEALPCPREQWAYLGEKVGKKVREKVCERVGDKVREKVGDSMREMMW